MKKLMLITVIILIAGGVYAQSGLFHLSYGMELAQADSTLRSMGFKFWENVGTMVKYQTDRDPMAKAVVLIVDPADLKVAGWLVRHDAALGPEDNRVVVERLYNMHGEEGIYDESTQQLVWYLTTSRSVHAMYWSDGSLVVMYYDLEKAGLFDVQQAQEEPVPQR